MAGPADRLLISVARLDRARLLAIVFTALVATAAALLLPGALAAAVDAAIAGRRSWPEVLWLLVLGTAEIAADIAGGILAARVTSQATAWLRRKLADRLFALGTRSEFADGDSISRLIGDCVRAGAITSIVVQFGAALLISTGAIVALALLDWRLALVFLGSIPFALLLARTHLKRTADDVLTYQRVSGELGARLLDAVAGLRTIAASGTADREAERVLRPLPRLSLAGRGMWRTQARMVWRAALLLPAVELAVLAAAGFGVLAGRLSVGDVLAALGYVALGMGLVTQIPLLTTLARARSCAERLLEVIDQPVPEPGKLGLLPGRGTLELRRVTLGKATLGTATLGKALRDVDLTITGGTFLAVVGRSGAGKSALAGVLGGLTAPDHGQVLLDGRGLHKLRPEELRAVVGYAFERPALLGATVADAVGYGSWAGDTAVRRACQAAQVHDVVVRLPGGYATPLAETPLSGGEAQRLGLARALVHSPRVLILDDATASLDTVTEAAVERAIESALPGRTRIVVTRRTTTAARADLVLWLEEGQVRAVASHAALWREAAYRAVFTDSEPGVRAGSRTDSGDER
ncbi:ABC transporter ATP-binding protein [Amycolatopsis sp. H20-H5]|uniref:ABC transporter ATP-binding protein n=1 Tax=Amycolatopsis sp. H20-H5 TaxID=3046309 RepID=UPI002DC0043A|nr:ABC transporter ATP-binding protein [Amycolatopsis sp. H20-H5]MEC3976956.1 ABC transporter ATP-binding protein [Amycolatopsis sp. H20-H5]